MTARPNVAILMSPAAAHGGHSGRGLGAAIKGEPVATTVRRNFDSCPDSSQRVRML
jgi:hypothetical protein